MSSHLGDIIKLVLSSNTGKIGIFLLVVLLLTSFYVMVSYPMDFGTNRWSAPLEWADNPKVVPPVWAKLLTRQSGAPHSIVSATRPSTERQVDSSKVSLFRLPLNYEVDHPPTFISFSVSDIKFHGRPPVIKLLLNRPDAAEVVLYSYVPRGPRQGEEFPVLRHNEEPLRILVSANESVRTNLVRFHNEKYSAEFSKRDLRGLENLAAFGVPDLDDDPVFKVLPGRYEFLVEIIAADSRDSMGSVKVVVGGNSFGVMGTDSLGRDLGVGLLFGFPVALFIGIMASTLSTAIGTLLGITSGYMGGWIDVVIQRLADIVANIPLLPILIFMVFIFGSNLFLIILLLVIFSWPGLTILIRSMVLQLRTGQFVEASLSLGASPQRIMLRHILPQIAPFVVAQMIFFTPAAILAEAGLSFLGLGDPSIPTWGQILEQGFRTGAVYSGYWWWVLPPGLLIVLTSVTFALIALALEPVVNPRLRVRS